MRAGLAALLAVGIAAAGAAAPAARADDNIFPPAPAAKPFVDFDGRGFLIGGKRTFLASGSLHYARVPRALWRDRLLRFKRAGFNTVQSYVFWDFHEPREGRFDFSGDRDLDAFLKLVKEMGMYAVVRVGPYSCAEWDSGGFPVWLRFKPGVRVREDDPAFEAALDRWWDKLLPIVAANQIHRGGAVILVQLENEHPQGWGTEMPNGYFRHMKDKAVADGIEVPLFFSGLHHGSDPAGGKPWDSAGRQSPWYTTEFWPGWYDLYGPLDDGRLRKFDRGTWKILAYGGNGYNYYMLHGGTNFAYWNNNEDASSYDYGAAVGQAGDLRPIYYRFKRAAWFARSFPAVLEDSRNATDAYQGAATDPAVRVTARQSPAGTILFLDNPGYGPVDTRVKDADGTLLPAAGSLTLAPGEILPVVKDYALLPGVTLQWAPTRVLGIAAQGNTTTLVIYGPTGSPAELRFAVPAGAVVNKGEPDLAVAAPGRIVLNARFPAGAPAEYAFTTGGRRVRVLAVSDVLADYTWFVEAGGQDYVVCGPDYVADAAVDARSGRLRLTAELPWAAMAPPASVAYGPGDAPLPLRPPAPLTRPAAKPPALGAWEVQGAADAARPVYDDRGWTAAAGAPPQMGADGDVSAYAWYRTTLHVPAAGSYSLALPARDYAAPFLDGRPVPAADVHGGAASLDLTAGDHSLAVFTSHHGRDKMFGYLGPLGARDPKGIAGMVALRQPGPDAVAVSGWRYLPVSGRPGAAAPGDDAPGWADAAPGQDVFQGRRGFAWFRATLPAVPGGAAPVAGAAAHRALHFAGVDDNATVYLNGKPLGRHQGWDEPFDLPAGAAWDPSGPNVLTVLVQNTDGGGGVTGPVTVTTYRYDAPVTGWKLRGGPGGDPLAPAGWRPLAAGDRSGAPAFFRTRFTVVPPGGVGPHPVLRVTLPGMTRGSVWLNGHNLGRYPETVPVDGLYLPECWLKRGENSLVVFDEEGARPDRVALTVETAASRIADVLTAAAQ